MNNASANNHTEGVSAAGDPTSAEDALNERGGRVFLLGDDIDTDQLAPGQYMAGGIGMLAAHCLSDACPRFSEDARAGDVIVAGRNFGMGSSREQAAEVLCFHKLAGVISLSFAGIFFRNAINLGLPVLTTQSIDGLADGEFVALDVDGHRLYRHNTKPLILDPLPDNIRRLLNDGGLIPHLQRRFAQHGGDVSGNKDSNKRDRGQEASS